MDFQKTYHITGTIFFSVGAIGLAILLTLTIGSQIFGGFD